MLKLFNSRWHVADFSGLARCVTASASILATTVSYAQVSPPNSGSLLQTIPASKPAEQSQSLDLIEQGLNNTKAMTDVEGLKIDVKEIKIAGLTVLPPSELAPVVNKFVGPGKKFQDLLDAAGAVKRELARRGYFLADVVVPKQKIENGVVEILVVEGRIGTTKVEYDDNVKINRNLINSYLSTLSPGKVITARDVERALFLISDLSGVNAHSAFEPGDKVGTANLVVKVSKARDVDANIDADANGSQYTGVFRGGGTINWNNPLKQGDMLSVNYSRTLDAAIKGAKIFGGSGLDTGDQDYERVTYLTPVGQLGSKLGVSYSTLHYQLGTPLWTPSQASGNAYIGSIMAVQPLIRSRNTNVMATYQYDNRNFHDVTVGLQEDKQVKLYSLSLSGDLRDSLLGGGINIGNVVVTSGYLNINSPDRLQADSTGDRTEGGYGRTNLSYSRLQQLTKTTGFYFAYTEQWVTKNIDASEKISLGGPNGVRAYPQGEGAGDEGYVGTLEWRYGLPRIDKLPGDRTFVLFYDYAWSKSIKDPTVNDAAKNTTSLRGAGIGLNWEVQHDWSLRTTAAWRITATPTSETVDPQPRIYFQLNKKI